MKLVRENKYKGILKTKLLKRALALGLVGAMAISFTGCGKEKEEKVGFLVEEANSGYQKGLYSYVIDVNGFESDKVDFKDTLTDIRLAKIDDERKYGIGYSAAFYKSNLKLVVPECYSVYDDSCFDLDNFKCSLKQEVIKECAGNSYLVVYSSTTAKKDLSLNTNILSEGKEFIYKGDTFSSIAIYYNDELVAFKQEGAGSDCQNVIDATVGDVDLALSTVKGKGLLTETEIVDYNTLYEYQDSLNEQNKEKVK